MAHIRSSRAKYRYQCVKCSRVINKGQNYFRVEPFPIARIKGIEKVEHLCTTCVRGKEYEDRLTEDIRNWLLNYWMQGIETEYRQLPLLPEEPVTLVETKIHVVNITSDIIRVLWSDPNEIYKLTPNTFEELICDRLQAMGFGLQQVGGHSYHKDGGIDFVAWPQIAEFPYLMAIQVKHHRSPEQKTGPGPVRELLGVVQSLPFNVGVLITNTTFTPDAKWAAEQKSHLVRLRDIDDIQRWLENDFLDEFDWREIPNQIMVCPGVVIYLPRTRSK